MNLKRSLSAGSAALAVILVVTGCAPGTESAMATPAPASATATARVSAPPPPSAHATSVAPVTTGPHPPATVAPSTDSGTRSPTIAPQVKGSKKLSAGTSLAALESLPVKGRAPKTGYDRDQFGQAWADTDRNGCDTRNDMLARDLTGEQFKPGTRDCVVLSGVLDDPYTATEIHFRRGQDTSTAVQIDHVLSALVTPQLA